MRRARPVKGGGEREESVLLVRRGEGTNVDKQVPVQPSVSAQPECVGGSE